MPWKKLSQEEIKQAVFSALENNIQYTDQTILGIPASYLDEKVFNQDVGFLKDAPFISTLIRNPNHIGCHTMGESEPFFTGTQKLERELLSICAEDILLADSDSYDGYVASGGTEANIQAIWIYRNYYLYEKKAHFDEICILCSEDSHYSMDKAANLLNISIQKVRVNPADRTINKSGVLEAAHAAKAKGAIYFIVVANMMTTMYGSVDDVQVYVDTLGDLEVEYKLHVDGAYGGFYFPFASSGHAMTFQNPNISSFTLDAHKMAQAPYGTGIFLIRKGWMNYANTPDAKYVKGQDSTLIGSRSGANAVATWMILVKNGPYGWREKVLILQNRTDWMCQALQRLDLDYYRHPNANIITIGTKGVSEAVVNRFGLVPDDHNDPNCFKLVIMEHVTIEKLEMLVTALELEKVSSSEKIH